MSCFQPTLHGRRIEQLYQHLHRVTDLSRGVELFAKSMWAVLVIGLAIRILLAPFTGHPWDLRIWMDAGYRTLVVRQDIYEIGQQIHWEWGYYAYPPAWLAWVSLAQFFAEDLYVHVLVLKLPLIIADTVTALLLYRMFLRLGTSQAARRAFLLYYLNPFVILVGSVWGMFDSLPVMFTLGSVILLADRKFDWSAIFLGIGTLLKIYPSLLIPLILVYFERRTSEYVSWKTVRYLVIVASVVLIGSFPFLLLDWKSYISSMTGHMDPSLWFSYWSLLGRISIVFYWAAPWGFLIIFSVFYAAILWRFYSSELDLLSINRSALCIFLAFLVTSPKVNAQYLLWPLPHSFLDAHPQNPARQSFLPIFISAAGALSIFLTLPVNEFLILGHGGAAPSDTSVGLMAAGIIVLSLGTIGVILRTLGGILSRKRINPLKPYRRVILATMLILVLCLAASPVPQTLRSPRNRLVFAEPESLASGFYFYESDFGVAEFVRKYSPDYVILTFGPDFANTYRGYNATASVMPFIRAGYYDEWQQAHLRALISNLHAHGVRVLIGVSLLSSIIVGTRGFGSPWLESHHPEVLQDSQVLPNRVLLRDPEWGIGEGTKYYVYFGAKLTRIATDFGFDGACLTDLGSGGVTSPDEIGDMYLEVLRYLSSELRDRGLILMMKDLEDPTPLDFYDRILSYVDFIVLQTYPWSQGLYRLDTSHSLEYYVARVKLVIDSVHCHCSSRIILTLEFMDEQAGWVTPALFVQQVAHAYDELDVGGVLLAYANKYSPYSLTKVLDTELSVLPPASSPTATTDLQHLRQLTYSSSVPNMEETKPLFQNDVNAARWEVRGFFDRLMM